MKNSLIALLISAFICFLSVAFCVVDIKNTNALPNNNYPVIIIDAGHGGMDGVFQVFRVLGAKVAGEEDAGAGRKTGEKTNQQAGNVPAGGHGGQSCRANKMPDDDRVHAVVKVLEKLPGQNGHGKFQEHGRNAALGQVGRTAFDTHRTQPSFFSNTRCEKA